MTRFLALTVICAAFAQTAIAVEISPPAYGSSANFPSGPVVATNGSGFLTLWTITTGVAGQQVYGSVADAIANVLTPNAFVVMPNAAIVQLFRYDDAYVAIVRDAATGTYRVAFISANGGLQRFGPTIPGNPVTVAFNGNEFLIASYTGQYSPPAVIGQIMTRDGQLVRDNIPLADLPNYALTAAGNDFVVVTPSPDGIFIERLAPDGSEVLPRTRIAPGSPQYLVYVAAASSGDTVAVVWAQQSTVSGNPEIVHVAVVDKNGTTIGETQWQSNGDLPRASWAGSQYLVVNGGTMTRIDRTGTNTGAVALPPSFISSAALGDTLYVVSNRQQIVATTFSIASLSAKASVTLSNTLHREVTSSLASDGVGYLAVWSDQTGDAKRIAAARLNAEGTPIDGTQIDVSSGVPPDNFTNGTSPNVAFGSSVYLIVWQRNYDVLARRIDRFGNILDPQPIVLDTNAAVTDQAIAWNGRAFLVLWSKFGTPGAGSAFIAEDGTVTPAPSFASTAPGQTVAWNGKHFLTVSVQLQTCPFECALEPIAIVLQRFGADGTPIDPSPVSVPWLLAALPRIATSGDQFILAADALHVENGALPYAVETRVAHTAGKTLTVDDPVSRFRWTSATASNVEWDGNQYVIAWRYGDPFGHYRIGINRLDGTGVTKSASYIDAPIIDAADRPAIASAAAGTDLFTFSAIPSPGGISRIVSAMSSDERPMPAIPPAPLITSAVGTTRTAFVTWLSAPAELLGFLIENSDPFRNTAWLASSASADARSATIGSPLYASLSRYIRMRAFNAAGVSEPTASYPITPPPRNRSARH